MARGSRETTDSILKIAFVVLAIVIIYVIVLRHPKFLDWLTGLTGGLMTCAAVIGEIVTGDEIYADASLPHSVAVMSGGEVEEHGYKSGGLHVIRYIR